MAKMLIQLNIWVSVLIVKIVKDAAVSVRTGKNEQTGKNSYSYVMMWRFRVNIND